MRSRAIGAVLLAATLLAAGDAAAQSYVRGDCQSLATAPTRYDTPEHERWYKRFWTGQCDHIPMCISGAPNWNELVGKLLVKVGPTQRGVLLPKACRMGQLIGLEWSREKSIRKINTADLRVFNTTLEASSDTLKGLDKIELAARAKLAAR
jgi:hypothetical protein